MTLQYAGNEIVKHCIAQGLTVLGADQGCINICLKGPWPFGLAQSGAAARAQSRGLLSPLPLGNRSHRPRSHSRPARSHSRHPRNRSHLVLPVGSRSHHPRSCSRQHPLGSRSRHPDSHSHPVGSHSRHPRNCSHPPGSRSHHPGSRMAPQLEAVGSLGLEDWPHPLGLEDWAQSAGLGGLAGTGTTTNGIGFDAGFSSPAHIAELHCQSFSVGQMECSAESLPAFQNISGLGQGLR